MKSWTFILAAILASGAVNCRAQGAGSSAAPSKGTTVVPGITKAFNYEKLNGMTGVYLRGTALLPNALGAAAVQSQPGGLQVQASFRQLEPAAKFGPTFLTYVLWAISPEGRAINLGELVLDRGTSEILATTELQTFALIVTAEPYFGVTQPSDAIVMENSTPDNPKLKFEPVDTKYEFMKSDQYATNIATSDLHPAPMDRKVPFDLYQARNAVRIARASGADAYAG